MTHIWQPNEIADTQALDEAAFLTRYPWATEGAYRGMKRRERLRREAAMNVPATDRHPQSALLMLSDTHWGKRSASFSTAIARERIFRAGAKVDRIKYLSSGYKFDELIVWLGGDNLDGADIYPGQAHEQEVTDPLRQADQFSALMAVWVEDRLKTWPKVRIWTTPGNHGRSGKHAATYANFDIVAYQRIADKVASLGVEVALPDPENPFFAVREARGHRYLTTHGQFNASSAATERMVYRWHTTEYGPFDVLINGHLHRLDSHRYNSIIHLQNASISTGDTHARNAFGAETYPESWFIGISDSRPVTWMYMLDLGKD